MRASKHRGGGCGACAAGVLRRPIHSQQGLARAKGMEIAGALTLLDCRDLKGKTVTAGAMFCRKPVAADIVAKGGGCVLPVKDNQKNLRENVQTAFDEPVFPLSPCAGRPGKGQGRIEQRSIEVLPRKPPASRKNGRPPGAFAASRASGRAKKNGEWKNP